MTATTSNPTDSASGPLPNRRTAMLAGLMSALLALYLLRTYGWRQVALFAVGLGAGIALYHAAFGFTGAWRQMISNRRSAGLRAQMIMLAAAVLLFMPLLNAEVLFGTPLRGAVAPLSSSVLIGAFLFGIGMQLGGGCASGTLFTVGGGSVRMIVTLLAFIIGSVLGASHWQAWQGAPKLAPVSLLETLGMPAAIIVSLSMFALIWYGAGALERRRHGAIDPVGAFGGWRWLQGPWPLLIGALALAAVNVATLALAGRPWGVTSAFALWGAKAAAIAGIDVAAWPYWERAGPAAALEANVLNDITSVMNFGILLGAMAAAGLAGRFAPVWRIPLGSLAAAVLGGLLLGYGARIAYGCNIGAFFSGLASASLHGWLWFAAAFAGNAFAVRLRPLFGMDR